MDVKITITHNIDGVVISAAGKSLLLTIEQAKEKLEELAKAIKDYERIYS